LKSITIPDSAKINFCLATLYRCSSNALLPNNTFLTSILTFPPNENDFYQNGIAQCEFLEGTDIKLFLYQIPPFMDYNPMRPIKINNILGYLYMNQGMIAVVQAEKNPMGKSNLELIWSGPSTSCNGI